MSDKNVGQKFDPFSVVQAMNGSEWDAFLPLARHENIVAFRDPNCGEVRIRYRIIKNHSKISR